jgi:hypothetical protein
MIRQIRLFTGHDGRSHVEESTVDTGSGWLPAGPMRFAQSPPGSALDWHDAPHRQYVLTLTGTLAFVTRDGESFRLAPGDVLLAEDTAGGGHRWRLVDDDPCTRVYVRLPAD